MKFVITQDSASGLWRWVLLSASSGLVAKGATAFKNRQQLVDSLRLIRIQAPQSLVFDPTGGLYEGV